MRKCRAKRPSPYRFRTPGATRDFVPKICVLWTDADAAGLDSSSDTAAIYEEIRSVMLADAAKRTGSTVSKVREAIAKMIRQEILIPGVDADFEFISSVTGETFDGG